MIDGCAHACRQTIACSIQRRNQSKRRERAFSPGIAPCGMRKFKPLGRALNLAERFGYMNILRERKNRLFRINITCRTWLVKIGQNLGFLRFHTRGIGLLRVPNQRRCVLFKHNRTSIQWAGSHTRHTMPHSYRPK